MSDISKYCVHLLGKEGLDQASLFRRRPGDKAKQEAVSPFQIMLYTEL